MTTTNKPPPDISVVSPTYQEAQNIPALVAAIADALTQHRYEIIIADDFSDDGTTAICEQLATQYPVRLLSRRHNRGLSPAVIDGIAAASGEFVVVIDADLSHPPSAIPQLVAALAEDRGNFAIGSRYTPGGQTADDWPWWRRLNSWGATILAKPLAPLADPMSGFFALHKKNMPPPEQLSPIGYKIGLEIIVKAQLQQIVEVPIVFGDRQHGESKMTVREQLNYVRHLRRLYHYRWAKPMEILQFGAVGGIGFLWDALFYFGLQAAGVPHLWARAAAFWPGVTSNWFLNRIMTFKTRQRTMAATQWLKFVLASSFGFIINWGVYALLTSYVEFFSEYLFVAFIIGILVGAIFNFITADLLVFRRANK